MTPYEKIKKRCAEDPAFRARYLAMKARNNQAARDRAKAAKTPQQIEEEAERRKAGEARRVAAIVAANKSRAKGERRPDLPAWKKGKPGRLVSLCGWNGWG